MVSKKEIKNLTFFACFLLLMTERVFAFSISEADFETLRNGKLQNYTAPTTADQVRNKQQILDNFCQQSLASPIHNMFSTETEQYSAQNSLFLSLLCSQSNAPKTFHPTIDLNQKPPYLKDKISLKSLKYDSNCTDPDNKIETNCNLAKLSSNLIKDIISDLTTLKQAQLYGALTTNFTDTKSLEYSANLFAEQKLNIGLASSNETNFCAGTKHNYPKTCNQIKSNLKKFQTALNALKIINAKNLLENAEQKTKDLKICLANTDNPSSFDALFCNLFSSLETEKALNPFINQVYNELLRYFLFSSYAHYNLSLQTNPDTKVLVEINLLESQPLSMLKATNLTLKQLSEIQATYPFHIGMLAYQEDLLRLRNHYLSKMVTPFYTLFYKVQDVQVQK